MTRRIASFVIPSAILLALALVAPGCSDDSAPRSIVTVETINQSQVLDSDVYNNGSDKLPGTEDDFIIEDQVSVVIRNRPHDAGLNIRANGPFSSVVFERYEVRFTGDETLAPLFGAIHLRVASGATGTGIVTVVPAGYKTMPPLLVLRYGRRDALHGRGHPDRHGRGLQRRGAGDGVVPRPLRELDRRGTK